MSRRTVVAALVAIGALVAFAAPRASDEPDGLQRVARDEGFARAEREHALADGPLADYSVPGLEDENVSTGVSGLVGVALAFTVACGAFGLLGRIRKGRGT